MALGFNTGGTYGSRQIVPDKGMSKSNKPKVFTAEFGDGYEQRVAQGINNLEQEFSVGFATRPKAEADDIIGFLESTNGVTAFNFTFADTNASGNEETVKVYVKTFDQKWDYDDYYTCTATFKRVYEA